MNCFRGVRLLGIMGCAVVSVHGAEFPVRAYYHKVDRLRRQIDTFDSFLSMVETPDCPDRLKTFVILCCKFRILCHRRQPSQAPELYGLTESEKDEMFETMRIKLLHVADLFGSQHMRATCQSAVGTLDKPFTLDCLRRQPRMELRVHNDAV